MNRRRPINGTVSFRRTLLSRLLAPLFWSHGFQIPNYSNLTLSHVKNEVRSVLCFRNKDHDFSLYSMYAENITILTPVFHSGVRIKVVSPDSSSQIPTSGDHRLTDVKHYRVCEEHTFRSSIFFFLCATSCGTS